MDELLITLTCGFECKYNEIFGKEDRFLCPVCKNHEISANECLNMTKNKLVINQAMLDLKQQSLCEKLKNLEQFKIDPSFHLDENFSQLKNQIDLRREEIKLLMNKKIDDYCENLFAIIDKQKESKLNEFREKIENIFSNKEITELSKIGTNLDINSKLNLINENMANLDDKLNYIDKTMDALNEKSLVLNHSSYSWDIEKVFGQLGSHVKLNSDSDVIQSETTFQLWIKNFSKFKEGKILEAYSKPVKIKNFEWSIHAKSTRQSNTETALECCLQCRSLSKHNELPLNFAGEMRLLCRNQPDNNLVCKIENLVKYEEQLHGYSFLVPIDDILDPVKGFYNTSDDSITIEAWIKQSIRRFQVKKDSNKFTTGDDLENRIGLLNIVHSDSYEDIDSSSDRTDSDLEDTDSDSSSESDETDSDSSSDSDESDSDFSSDSDETDSDFGNDFDSDSDPYYTDFD